MNALNQSAELLARTYHLQLVLGVCETALLRQVKIGSLPKPDIGGTRRVIQWRLSTLRRFNPGLAVKVERVLKFTRENHP
jgi:hypothetical protein